MTFRLPSSLADQTSFFFFLLSLSSSDHPFAAAFLSLLSSFPCYPPLAASDNPKCRHGHEFIL
jgi:hypothetical protein